MIYPIWHTLGCLLSILIGALDDHYNISWKIKLIAQLFIVSFLVFIFWGNFTGLVFYEYSLTISQHVLFFSFVVWFVGIYNAVNLIDGLDGLASGFIIIFLLALSF